MIYIQILDKFKLSEEKCDDYCLWEMMGDGDQMTGKSIYNSIITFTVEQITDCMQSWF